MFTALKTLTASTIIGLSALTAIPTAAQADSIYLGFGGGDVRGAIHVRDHDRRDWRGNHDYDRRCTPQRAVNKAERMGLRRARVVDVDRRTIDVVGRRHGDRVRITFGRSPSCPIVRW